MILDKIVSNTKKRVSQQKSVMNLDNMKKLASSQNAYKKVSFKHALIKDDIAVIAEVKKGSPSKGIISESFDYLQIARDYESAGASAISVLTEPYHFLGNNDYLSEIKRNANIPILRKDFIIDEYQIYEASAIGADAVLLIAAILEQAQISEYIQIAKSLSLDCLVEIHDADEAAKAMNANAEIIGINNRDLKTFEVDFSNTLNLIKIIPRDKIIVSESGIKTNTDIQLLRNTSVNAVLIGETFMRSHDKSAQMKELMKYA